jgi:hypothetical protein
MDGGNARQQHGLDFEAWLKDTFFSSCNISGNTDKWDFTGVAYKSKYSLYTSNFGGLPISVKTCKFGTPIGFGDALRQMENEEDFLLIVCFWKAAGEFKKCVSVEAVMVSSHLWKRMFVEKMMDESDEEGDSYESDEEEFTLMTSKIRKLDSVIKDRSVGYQETRIEAKKLKKELHSSTVVFNPKIDSKGQRRLQCSLPFKIFWSIVAGKFPFSGENVKLWGEEVPKFK